MLLLQTAHRLSIWLKDLLNQDLWKKTPKFGQWKWKGTRTKCFTNREWVKEPRLIHHTQILQNWEKMRDQTRCTTSKTFFYHHITKCKVFLTLKFRFTTRYLVKSMRVLQALLWHHPYTKDTERHHFWILCWDKEINCLRSGQISIENQSRPLTSSKYVSWKAERSLLWSRPFSDKIYMLVHSRNWSRQRLQWTSLRLI